MSTLARCIEISGIHPSDGNRLEAVAKSYRAEGFKAQESNKRAIKDAIKEIETERKGIISQIKATGVPTVKKEPVKGPAKKTVKKPTPEIADIGEIGNFNVPNLAKSFLPILRTGEKLNKIGIQTEIAKKLGLTRSALINNPKYSHKPLEEAFEYAIVLRAKEIISESDTVLEAYAFLKAMHDAQPLLSTRTSTSIKQQMYSTPVHLAFLAQAMANANNLVSVYEPSAGTGMLMTVANPKNVTVNEIDKGRIDILKDQGFDVKTTFGEIAVRTGLVPQRSFDAVLANPPFGSIAPVKIDGYTLSKTEHLMIADALKAMKNNGNAAFIIGGKNFDKGKMNSVQKVFLNWLYNHYHVKYNIDIPGKEYTRQGATFPIRLIVVNGRKTVPEGAAPVSKDLYQAVTTIDELITGGFIDGSLDASRLGEVSVSEGVVRGVRPEGIKDVIEELPSIPRREGERIDTKVEEGRGKSGTALGRPAAEGIPEGRLGEKPVVTRPARPDEPRPGRLPTGVRPDVVSEGKAKVAVSEEELGDGRRKAGKPEGISRRVEGVDVSGVPGVNAVVDELLELSKKESKKAATREKTVAAKKKFDEGAKEVAEGFKELNALFGEEGWIGDREQIPDTDPIWVRASEILQRIWNGIGKMVASVKERAAVFIKEAYSSLRSEATPYVDKFITDVIKVELEAEEIAKEVKETKIEKAKAAGAKEYQVIYIAKSKGPIVDETLMPRNMYESVTGALNDLGKEVGDVDEYVRKKLKYKNTDDLFRALSSDQIDAVALAIRNMDKGIGTIVGDQTGVGKGRIAAAIMEYAKIKGHKPIFFTEKPNLFTDIYRDIVDIGRDFDPFIMASQIKNGTILDKQERAVHVPPNPKERSAALEKIKETGEKGLGEKDSLVSTYSQINKRDNPAQKAIEALSVGNVFVLDESHNASGQSKTGEFVRRVLEKADSVLYLSATFAKRPDTMPLYFRTALSDSNLSMTELVDAITAGGIPLQETMSSDLAKLGQYLRREKSFKGITIISKFNTKNKKIDTERANGIASVLSNIVRFDKNVAGAIGAIREDINAGGTPKVGDIFVPGATVEGTTRVTSSITTSNFASVVHNAIRQSLLALKTDMAADAAIQELGAGRKPIIALSNTMGSFVKDQMSSGELEEGQPFNLTLGDVMKRHLRRTLHVVVTSPQGTKSVTLLPLSGFSMEERETYKNIEAQIDKMPGSDLTGNPIDYIRMRIVEAGYTVDELTGRDFFADLTDPQNPILTKRAKANKDSKNLIVNKFNNGQIDCLIVNSAGASGLSLHAAPGVKDKSPRTYLGLQAELNVDTEVQKMGRINRKGQVSLPSYQMLYMDIPTEIRPAAVLSRKLKSLSANTSAGADSPIAQKTLPDMMDKYGDVVARDWIRGNERFSSEMGIVPGDDMHKITGRLALMPTVIQELFYTEIEQEYASYIDFLKEEGAYDLEVGEVDFKAETVEKKLLTQGENEKNPFGASTYREELKVTMPDKPYNKKKIDRFVKERLGNKSAEDIAEGLVEKVRDKGVEYFEEQKKELSDEDVEGLRKKLGDSFNEIHRLIKDMLIGEKFELASDSFGRVGAVVLDVKFVSREGNPLIKSKFKITFAVNSAVQKTTIAFSKMYTTGPGAVDLQEAFADMWINWDETIAEAVTQTRYMITGNLVQGYADATEGSRIVRYTTKDGKTKEGILLPLLYHVDAREDNVRIIADQAASLVINETVQRIDSGLTNVARVGNEYILSVPLSRVRGGIFFLDAQLLSLAKNEFESRAGLMEARITRDKIIPAMRRLYELGEVFKVDRTTFEGTFDKGAAAKKDEEPLYLKRKPTPSIGAVNASDLRSEFDKITSKWKNAPEIEVVQTQNELPEVIKIVAGKEVIIDGSYYQGKVYIVADNQASVETAIKTLLHESFGHYGIRGVLGQEFANIMEEVYIAKKEEINKIAGEYDFDINTARGRVLAAEEWLAREAVTNPESGWIRRLIEAIRRFVNKIMPSFTLSDFDVRALLESARTFVERKKTGTDKYPSDMPLYQMAGKKAIGAPSKTLPEAKRMSSRMEDIRAQLVSWSRPEIVVAKDGGARKFRIVNSRGEYLDRYYTREDAQAKIDSMASLAREAMRLGEKEVWRKTGWIKGAEGEWKFEIDDKGAALDVEKFNEGAESRMQLATRYLRDNGIIRPTQDITAPMERSARVEALAWADKQIEDGKQRRFKLCEILRHPLLFRAYPSLKNIAVIKENNLKRKGSYNPRTNTIAIGGGFLTSSAVEETLLHEIQHAIQAIEGFAKGGAPVGMFGKLSEPSTLTEAREIEEELYDNVWKIWNAEKKGKTINEKEAINKRWEPLLKQFGQAQEAVKHLEEKFKKNEAVALHGLYLKLAGEIEARDTVARAEMTLEQRREQMPYTAEGIPKDQWIITKGKGTSFSVSEKPVFAKRKKAAGIDISGFLPKEVEKQIAESKGVPKKTWKETLSETLIKVKAQKHHRPELQTIEDKDLRAKVEDTLRRHQEVPETAKNQTIQMIHSFTEGLSKDGYQVYRMNIFLADMMRDIRNGLTYDGKLPFGFKTTDEVKSAYEKFQKAADQNPEISKALKKRFNEVNKLKKRLVDAKLLKKEVMEEDDYFHHQIIKYWRDKQGMATGSKDVRTHWRPWMTARKGSMLNYNTDYIEAEYSAISQQLEQVLTVETLQRLKKDADVYAKLKREAKTKNVENLWSLLRKQGKIEKNKKTDEEVDPLLPWKQKIAMSNAALAKMASSGTLEYDSEWQGLIDKLAASHEMQEPGVDDVRWFDFLSYLVNTKKAGANWAATIVKAIKDRDKFIEDTLGDKFLTYEDLFPKEYVGWKPDPNKGWFWANVITDKILEKIQRGEIDPADVETRQLLAKGSDLIWVIPKGLAEALDNFRGQPEQAWVGQAADRTMRAWKQYILLNPYSVIRYNLNNFSGDLDACLAYAPEIGRKYAWQAFHDLRKWHKREKLDPRIQKEIDFAQSSGAIQSGFSMQEVDDATKVLSTDKKIRDILLDENPNWFTRAEWFGFKTLTTKYWGTVRRLTALRENVLRLAAFRFFNDNQEKRLYGASQPTEIDAIADPREKSAKLSRELFGDYGNISKSGEYIRKRLVPFWSWMEINAPRYVYLMRNTKYENRDVDSVKKQMAAVAGKKLILSSAKMALRASMLMGAVLLWNLTMFPDEEEELGETGRRQMHIILGRREDGSIITLRFQGALSDALSFFALEDWPADMKDVLEGKRTVGEKLKEIPLALLNRGVHAIRPEPKMLGEMISGKAFYPDVTRPLPIRDRMEHALRTFKLDKIYRAALERPGRGKTPGASREWQMAEHFLTDLKSLLIYESDPGLLAYYDVRSMVFDWLAKQGDIRRYGGRPTRKGNALYYYKQAMKFGDLDAAQRYLKKYYELGGTRKSGLQSIKHAHPLSSLPKMKRNAFRLSLDARQEARLKLAIEWYGKAYK